MNKHTSIFGAVGIAMTLGALSQPATVHGAIRYWDGNDTTANADGGNGIWNIANTNWDTAATGGASVTWDNAAPDSAVFGVTGGTVTMGAARSAAGITFTTGSYIISNTSTNVLTIGSGGITQTAAVASTNQIGSGVANTGFVTLSASQVWLNQSTATLFQRDGDLVLGANTLTLTSTGGGSINAAGTTTGAGSIIVSANTSASMSGNNTYSGTTTINSGGILTVNSFGNFNAASGVGQKASNLASNLVIDGGTLRVQVNSATSNRLFTMGSGGATLEARLTGGNSGQILLSNTAALAYTGVGDRTLTLGGNSDDVGGSSISLAIADVGGGNGTVSLVKNEAHNWTVDGTNSYSGGTTVNAGTLTMGSAAALGSTSGQLTVNGGTLNLAGNSLTVGNLTGTGGTISGTSGSRTLTIGQGNNGGGNFQGSIVNGSGGTTALIKTGNAAITLSGANTYSGATNVSAGTLLVNGTHNAAGGTYSVGSSGTLGGTGSISASDLDIDGILSPGATSIESLLVTAPLTTFGSTSQLSIEINESDANIVDLLGITGDLTINSGAVVSFNVTGPLTLPQYVFGTYTETLSGSFTSFTVPTGYQLVQAGGELKLSLIPEPGSFTMLAFGMLSLWLIRKRS